MLLLNLLLKIVEICFAFNISEQMICDLEELIALHHRQFKNLFPDTNAINKHHHVTHYPEIIRQKGPLVLYSCLNFEAKHQVIKKFISRGCNFINLPKSISNYVAVDQSMNIIHQFYTVPHEEIVSWKEQNIENCICQQDILQKHPYAENVTKIFVIKINNMRFTNNVIITLCNENTLYPNFYIVKEMVKIDNQTYFFMQVLITIEFVSELNSYKVDNTDEMVLLNIKKLEDFKPNSVWQNGLFKYISIKEYQF